MHGSLKELLTELNMVADFIRIVPSVSLHCCRNYDQREDSGLYNSKCITDHWRLESLMLECAGWKVTSSISHKVWIQCYAKT